VDIKATDVKKLREITGAGMMDCKKALTEAGGDFKKAERILKEMGLAAAAKRSGRATNEGRIFTLVSGSKAGLLEIACETDFVAMNKDFITVGNEILSDVVEKELSELPDELKEKVAGLVSKLKENMEIRRFTTTRSGENELLVDYVHGEGRIGVIIKMGAESPEALADEKVKEFAFNCALHAAAFNPLYLSSDKVDPEYLKEQEEIFTKQAESLGKPEKVVAGIVKGKLNKHLSEICFVDQKFVKDDKQSVSKVMESLGKEVGTNLTLTDYLYYRVGEEI